MVHGEVESVEDQPEVVQVPAKGVDDPGWGEAGQRLQVRVVVSFVAVISFVADTGRDGSRVS
ncbi:hypothetical protein ACFQ9H_39615 [Streptomyces sp. NPDC056517]|uniref:hypothetical protein n=1 Tax=Streptomyces sp. NPDC056517 TaxID=3345848 RepID=UPI0036B561FE